MLSAVKKIYFFRWLSCKIFSHLVKIDFSLVGFFYVGHSQGGGRGISLKKRK